MANKKAKPLPFKTADDVIAANTLGALEADEYYIQEMEYRMALADFDHFIRCLAGGKPIPPAIAERYAENLKRIDIRQESSQLGSDLVRAFKLDKAGIRSAEFQRNIEIAYMRIKEEKTREEVAERYGISPRQITRIVEEYKAYIEASEQFFPT